MFKPEADTFDPQLLDWHLRQLDPRGADDLQRRLADAPDLAAQHECLGRACGALEVLRDVRAPDDLALRVCLRVASQPPAPRVIRPAAAAPRADDLPLLVEERNARDWILRRSNVRDLVAIAAMIILAIGVGVPGFLHMKEQNQRMLCTSNLRSLGFGLQQYARTYNASLPFTGWSRQSTWAAPDAPGSVATPNRTHVYPLLQLAFIRDPSLFVCPGRKDVPMPREEIARRDRFLEARNLSYAYYNMAGVHPRLDATPELPILADDNPLFEEGLPLLDARVRGLGDLARANSQSHHGAGQNVLLLGGVVKWTSTPDCGVDGDNIWLLDGVQRYTGREGPLAATDAHLIK